MAAHRPRDCDDAPQLSRDELDRLGAALKDEEFRKLLVEYCEDVQKPENVSLYRREFAQLEKERGYLVTFVEPKPGFVVKTSRDGAEKAFVNVCSCEGRVVDPASYDAATSKWSLPYALAPPRRDYDRANRRCEVYDVVFHAETLRLAARDKRFKKLLVDAACEAVRSNHRVDLDPNNLKYPKLSYKGTPVATVVRKPDPDYRRDTTAEPTLLEQLYPQNVHSEPKMPPNENEYTTPKYTIKQRKNIEMEEFTYERDAKRRAAKPTSLVVEVDLPSISTTEDVVLDVRDKSFSLVSEKPAKYKLDLALPYKVNGDAGSARFDLSERKLTVTLPVDSWRSREDSGVESDTNSRFSGDDDVDSSPSRSVEEDDRSERAGVGSPGIEVISECETYRTSVEGFLDDSVSYVVPTFALNVFNNLLVLTLDVKNVDSDSVVMREDFANCCVKMKFSSLGAGFFPIRYAFVLMLPPGTEFGQSLSEVWDNNVILQIEVTKADMDHFTFGLKDAMVRQELDAPLKIANVTTPSPETSFLRDDKIYVLPSYVVNTFDSIMAFTFHVKKVIKQTFVSESFMNGHALRMKFSNGESDYAFQLKLPEGFVCVAPSVDVWDDNVVTRVESEKGTLPDHIFVGLNEEDMQKYNLQAFDDVVDAEKKNVDHIIEVTAKGTNETNISLHKCEEPTSVRDIPRRSKENDESICSSSGSFKSILKHKNRFIGRSLSESNVDLMDFTPPTSYSLTSTDCIPEESSSLKKTVRFSNIITKQTFRTNSSILGQKSKNQRKKQKKKRALERRSSEGDPDDMCLIEIDNNEDVEERGSNRDIESFDTDDGDSGDNEKSDNPIGAKYEKEKHSSLFTKEKKKGKYQEVNFKNDLIFDLDM